MPYALKEKLDTIVSAIETVSQEQNVVLNVVGVTEQQFVELYNWTGDVPIAVKFWGRVEHKQVIKIVKSSDWAIILRDNNRVVKAGFPTKVVESISCGTPVLVNHFSNIEDYLNNENSIFTSMSNLEQSIIEASKKKSIPNTYVFDYRNYLGELDRLLI